MSVPADPMHDPLGLVQKLMDSAESCLLSSPPPERGPLLSACLALAVKSGRVSLLCQAAALFLAAEGAELPAEASYVSLLEEIATAGAGAAARSAEGAVGGAGSALACDLRAAFRSRCLRGGTVLSCGKGEPRSTFFSSFSSSPSSVSLLPPPPCSVHLSRTLYTCDQATTESLGTATRYTLAWCRQVGPPLLSKLLFLSNPPFSASLAPHTPLI